VAKAITFLDKEYSIVIMDPPYSDSSIGNFITQIAPSKLIRGNAVVVVTHSPHLSLNPIYAPLSLLKEHRHGDSCIAVYVKEGLS
jgi:16S rRNA G966 N2-methylase RsmD